MLAEDIKKFIRYNFSLFVYLIFLFFLFFSDYDTFYNSSGNIVFLWVLLPFSFILSIVMDKFSFKLIKGDKIYERKFIFLYMIINLVAFVIYYLLKISFKDEVIYIFSGSFSKFYFVVFALILAVFVMTFVAQFFEIVDKQIFGEKNIKREEEKETKGKVEFFFIDSSYLFSSIMFSAFIFSVFENLVESFNLLVLQRQLVLFVSLIAICFIIDLIIIKISLIYKLKTKFTNIIIVLVAIALYFATLPLMEMSYFTISEKMIKTVNFIGFFFKLIALFSTINIISEIINNKQNSRD